MPTTTIRCDYKFCSNPGIAVPQTLSHETSLFLHADVLSMDQTSSRVMHFCPSQADAKTRQESVLRALEAEDARAEKFQKAVNQMVFDKDWSCYDKFCSLRAHTMKKKQA